MRKHCRFLFFRRLAAFHELSVTRLRPALLRAVFLSGMRVGKPTRRVEHAQGISRHAVSSVRAVVPRHRFARWRLAAAETAGADHRLAHGCRWRPGFPAVQRRLVRRQGSPAERRGGASGRAVAGHDATAAGPAAEGQPAVAAFAAKPQQHRGGHRRAAGRPGGGTPGCAGGADGHPGRPGRGRPESGRFPAFRAGLAERQGASAVAGRRAYHGDGRADRGSGDPQLGNLQHRPADHPAVRPAEQLGGAQPGQRPERPAEPDPGPDQGRRHGDGGQPQRCGVQRQQPGQRTQPGGCRRQHQRQPVPRTRPVFRRQRQPAELHRRRRRGAGGAGLLAADRQSGQLHRGGRLRAVARQRGGERRADRHAQGPGHPGGGRQLLHSPWRRHRWQPALYHPRQ